MEARFSARFVEVPKGATALTFPDYSRDVVSEIERLLERARTETTALAEDQAAQALDQAERLLRAHPELPQAAWLMAERHQLAALLAERTQTGSAGQLRKRAAVLEPERAPAFGQDPGSVARSPSGEFQLALRGLGAHDAVEWNGAELAFPARVEAGEHHLRVIRNGALAWAGWVSVSSAVPVLQIDVPSPVACSLAELGATQQGGDRPLPPAGVDCPAWAALRFERGRFELSLCRRSECGPWRAESDPVAPPRGPRVVGATGFPLWASIALAGAGAALLTSVTLWQTGAFDRDERKSTRWVYEGYVPPASEP
jgi:hypothetical protein